MSLLSILEDIEKEDALKILEYTISYPYPEKTDTSQLVIQMKEMDSDEIKADIRRSSLSSNIKEDLCKVVELMDEDEEQIPYSKFKRIEIERYGLIMLRINMTKSISERCVRLNINQYARNLEKYNSKQFKERSMTCSTVCLIFIVFVVWSIMVKLG